MRQDYPLLDINLVFPGLGEIISFYSFIIIIIIIIIIQDMTELFITLFIPVFLMSYKKGWVV